MTEHAAVSGDGRGRASRRNPRRSAARQDRDQRVRSVHGSPPARCTLASSSAWAAAKKGSPKPNAIEPATYAMGSSSTFITLATALPTSRPVRSMIGRTRLRRRAAGDRLDRRTRRFGLDTADAATTALPTVRNNDHVSHVAGIAGRALEQRTVQDDSAADARRHDHRQVVALPDGRAEPALAERQGLRVHVAVDLEPEHVLQPIAQRELAPGHQIEGRDRLDVAVIGPAAPTPQPCTCAWRAAATSSASHASATSCVEGSFGARPVVDEGLRAVQHVTGLGHRVPAANFVAPMSSASTTSFDVSLMLRVPSTRRPLLRSIQRVRACALARSARRG